MIQSLALRRPFSATEGIADVVEWKTLGKRGEAWREYCLYLMGGPEGKNPVRLAAAATRGIPARRLRVRPVWVIAGGVAAALVIAAIVLFVTHRKSTVAAEAWKPYLAANWFHEPAKPEEEADLHLAPRVPATQRSADDPLAQLGDAVG